MGDQLESLEWSHAVYVDGEQRVGRRGPGRRRRGFERPGGDGEQVELGPLRACPRRAATGERRPGLEPFEDRLRPADDALGEASEPRARDAVAAGRRAALELVEEDDLPRVLTRRDTPVLDGVARSRELRELVVVGREQGATGNDVVEMVD